MTKFKANFISWNSLYGCIDYSSRFTYCADWCPCISFPHSVAIRHEGHNTQSAQYVSHPQFCHTGARGSKREKLETSSLPPDSYCMYIHTSSRLHIADRHSGHVFSHSPVLLRLNTCFFRFAPSHPSSDGPRVGVRLLSEPFRTLFKSTVQQHKQIFSGCHSKGAVISSR